MEGSDHLLIFLLKARRPEVYRERTEVKHSGQVERPPASQVAEMQRLAASDDQFRDAVVLVSRKLADQLGDEDDA